MTIGNQKVKWGYAQRNNPTPKRINDLFDAISGLLGLIAGFFAASAYISHEVSDVVVSIINMLLIPACPFIKRLYGVQIDQKRVRTEDVAVIDETKDN